jgi:hypothetical protein
VEKSPDRIICNRNVLTRVTGNKPKTNAERQKLYRQKKNKQKKQKAKDDSEKKKRRSERDRLRKLRRRKERDSERYATITFSCICWLNCELVHLMKLHYRKSGFPDLGFLPQEQAVKDEFDKAARQFEENCSSIKHNFCEICKRVSMTFEVKIQAKDKKNVCNTCLRTKRTSKEMEKVLPVWKQKDGTIRYDLPLELKQLSEAEKLLISPYLVYVPLHHMQKGQVGCKGHVCCFEQDVASVSNVLPRMPRDIALVRVVKKYKEDTGEISSKTFTVRRLSVINALTWLKQYSQAYEDIEIDLERLSWMGDEEEKQLPAVKETVDIQEEEISNNRNSDRGPAVDQVDDVIQKETEHNEVLGSTMSNATGEKMSTHNAQVNEQLSDAFRDHG